jgi:membrane protein implicated in regulation of membrane protease activity
VGAGYTVISFLLGEVLNALDFDADFDFFGGIVSPLKPSVIAAFLTVFGGVGLIGGSRFGVLIVLPVAVALGVLVSFLLYRFVIVPLYRAQNTSVLEKQGFIGLPAKVTERIPQGKYGKITYSANGNTYAAPAKSHNGGEIERNAAVTIMYIDKNTYFVEKNQREGN